MSRGKMSIKRSLSLTVTTFCVIGVLSACTGSDKSDGSSVSNQVSDVSNSVSVTSFRDTESKVNKIDSFKYKSPKKLDSDPMSCVIRLQGDCYKLPTPVSEFTKNGWTIVVQADKMAGNQEVVSGLCMEKNGVQLLFNIKNYSDKVISSNDALVTSICVNGVLLKDIDFELSGGIKFGMTKNEISKIINLSGLRKTIVTTGCEYTYENRSQDGFKYYKFSFDKDDKLTDIFINNTVLD